MKIQESSLSSFALLGQIAVSGNSIHLSSVTLRLVIFVFFLIFGECTSHARRIYIYT